MIFNIFVSLVILYIIFLIVLYFFQRRLIYFPSQKAPLPAYAGVPEMEVINLHTADGLTLKAWYRPHLMSHSATLVYFHGNAGHIGLRAPLVKPYLDAGFGVLLLTYRGYSGNPGNPDEEGLYRDGRAALEFLKQQGVPENSLVLVGESIGCAVAIELATKYNVGALVLQAPFTSLRAVGAYHYPLIMPVSFFIKDKYDSLHKADKIHAPVLIIHGNKDKIIPPIFSERLFDALPEPKQAIYVPNRGHNNLLEPNVVIDFIERMV